MPQHELSFQNFAAKFGGLAQYVNTNHQMHFITRRLRPPKDMIKLQKFWKGSETQSIATDSRS
jgi:hypothetical protein